MPTAICMLTIGISDVGDIAMRTMLTLTVIASVVVLAPLRVAAQAVSEDPLLEWLRDPRLTVREGAVAYIIKEIGPEKRGPALDKALAEELATLNEDLRKRRETDRAGVPLTDDFPAEYHASVVAAVSSSSNPVGIPALAGALGTGRMVEEGLAHFGDQAVPAVVQVARLRVGNITTGLAGDTPPHVVAGALNALSRLAEQRKRPLSIQSRAQIIGVAHERLSGTQETGIVAAACRLAVATADPALKQRVQRLAEDTSELGKMGLDLAAAEFVQKVARESLGGK